MLAARTDMGNQNLSPRDVATMMDADEAVVYPASVDLSWVDA
jgi:hypothetical protein